MDNLFKPDFWNMRRRAWLYGVMVSLMPILITAGTVTGELAGMILNAAGVFLGVSGGTMALTNLTPDNVLKVGLEVQKEEEVSE